MASVLDNINKLKFASRQSDLDRLTSGAATPQQVQSENSFIPSTARIRITNLREHVIRASKRRR